MLGATLSNQRPPPHHRPRRDPQASPPAAPHACVLGIVSLPRAGLCHLRTPSTPRPFLQRWVNLSIYRLLAMEVPWEADPTELAAEAGQVGKQCLLVLTAMLKAPVRLEDIVVGHSTGIQAATERGCVFVLASRGPPAEQALLCPLLSRTRSCLIA